MIPSTPAEFHAHLDRCQQCREHPFALCPEGARVLKAAALASVPKTLADVWSEQSDEEYDAGARWWNP